MGHKRKSASPSPLRLLSIFDARHRGIPLPEIARRTQHSISSIMRWTEKYGHEVDIFHAFVKAYPNMADQIRFEAHYPDRMLSVAPAVEESETDSAASSVHINQNLSDLFVHTNQALDDVLRNK